MKRIKILLAIVLLIFVGSLILCWFALQPEKASEVEIVQDGTVLYQFDLTKVQDQIIEVTYDGRSNTILIQNGKICVSDAECPDHTCVHMGWLQSKALPIVCLPNRLVIRFAEDNGADAALQ